VITGFDNQNSSYHDKMIFFVTAGDSEKRAGIDKEMRAYLGILSPWSSRARDSSISSSDLYKIKVNCQK